MSKEQQQETSDSNEPAVVTDDVNEPAEVEPKPEPEQAESVEEKPAENTEDSPAEADEVLVTIGDEDPPAESDGERAPQWVRELRKSHRDMQRKLREYEEREQASPVAQPAAISLPSKPTLEAVDYDTEKYEVELESWYRKRDQIETAKREAQAQADEQKKAWSKKLDAYGEAKQALKVRDYDDAEHALMDVFNNTQQGIVIQGAENPALVVYALGKNLKKAKELAAIDDAVKFAFAVAKLEAQLKVQPRKQPPAPEKPVPTGTASASSSADAHLERLRAEAEKTGDLTRVIQYRAQLKQKQAK